ncbi:unnamed protein product, partial [Scytosiphon promiscuus]
LLHKKVRPSHEEEQAAVAPLRGLAPVWSLQVQQQQEQQRRRQARGQPQRPGGEHPAGSLTDRADCRDTSSSRGGDKDRSRCRRDSRHG